MLYVMSMKGKCLLCKAQVAWQAAGLARSHVILPNCLQFTYATLTGWLSKLLLSRQNYNYIPHRCYLFSTKVSSLTFPSYALHYCNAEHVVQLADNCIFSVLSTER
jgi:hypothetical protein